MAIERSSAGLALLRIDPLLSAAFLGRPFALDEGEDGDDVPIIEHLAEGGHVALERWWSDGRPPFLGVVEKDLVRVVPGVSGFVVGRGGQAAVP